MATMENLIQRVRLELGDIARSFDYEFFTDGQEFLWEIPNRPLDIPTVAISIEGIVLDPGQFSVESPNGLILFPDPPPEGSVINVSGMQFRYFSDPDLTTFVGSATTEHLYNRTNSYGSPMELDDIPSVEEYPMAVLATIKALWALATDAAFDIDISAPDGVSIPRSERYRQLMEMIEARQNQYDTLAAALNVGIHSVEIVTLRRVARSTNRLVPVYIEQEVDDPRPPERVWKPISREGAPPFPSTAGAKDLVIHQGDTFSETLDLGVDVTGWTFAAQAKTVPTTRFAWADFETQIIDAANGLVRIALTSAQTKRMPLRAFWELQATLPDGSISTRLRGAVFCQREVVL